MRDERRAAAFKSKQGIFSKLAAIFRGRAQEHAQNGDMKKTVLNWQNARLAAGVATLAAIAARIASGIE